MDCSESVNNYLLLETNQLFRTLAFEKVIFNRNPLSFAKRGKEMCSERLCQSNENRSG